MMRHPPFSRNLKDAMLALEKVRAGHSLSGENFAPTVHYLLYETLRDFAWGQWVLGKLLRQPLKNQQIQSLLLIALSFLKRNPQRAFMLVDQSVSLCKSIAPKMVGLCNAVLRQFLRQTWDVSADESAYFQHPKWWIDEVKKDFPNQWQAILAAGNRAPVMALRVNPRRIHFEDYVQQLREKNFSFTVENHAIFLDHAVPSAQLPGFEEGLIHVQDWGAQQAWEFLKNMPADLALDACAAPGGKTALWLENVPQLKLIALDKNPKRAQELTHYLRKYHLHAKVFCADCCDFKQEHLFSAILADCPCTGSGVAGRHPDAKWLKKQSDIEKFAQMQQNILHHLWGKLAPNGKMLFVTCSVFKTENEKNTALFLQNHRDARLLEQKIILPSSKNDGFFYALLCKTK